MRAVRQLAAFYRPTPNQFNEEQLRSISYASRITVRTQNPFAVRSAGAIAIIFPRKFPMTFNGQARPESGKCGRGLDVGSKLSQPAHQRHQRRDPDQLRTVARMIISMTAFDLQRDWTYVVITLIVLAALG